MGFSKGTFWVMLFMGVGVLSSCSSLRKPAGGRSTTTANKQNVQFLDGISMNRGGSSTYAKGGGYATLSSSAFTSGSNYIENAQAWQFKYAQLLDVAVETVNNYRLYGFIEDWWGTPYRLGGKNKDGVDCSAFVSTLLSVVFQESFNGTSQQMYEQTKKLRSRSELQEGDLVFFSIGQKKRVSHVGVYLDHDRFVHASTSAGVMISDLNEAYWTKYYTGGGRVE
ncbi:MAG TPA: NlpC/P60 family protein [Chitinophaga sp.]|uniref:NlpC/P60 family protein n=1 Tax=Chitinophaga sp. TaxID=1869181 RepID=UPI002F94EE0E